MIFLPSSSPTWDMLEGTTCPSGKNSLYGLHRGWGGGWKFWEPLGSIVVRNQGVGRCLKWKKTMKLVDRMHILAGKHVAMSRVGLRTCLFKNLWAFVFKWWFPIFSFMFVQFFFFSRAFVGIKSHSLAPWFRQALLSLQGFRKAELLAAFHRFDVRREGA